MNSLNIITARVSPPPSPGPSRSNSFGPIGLTVESDEGLEADGLLDEKRGDCAVEDAPLPEKPAEANQDVESFEVPGEHVTSVRSTSWHALPRRIATSFINSIRWVLSTLAAPGVYLFAFLCDTSGAFAPFSQLKRLFGKYDNPKLAEGNSSSGTYDEKTGLNAAQGAGYGTMPSSRRVASSGSSSSGLSSESESDPDGRHARRDPSKRHTRSKTLHDAEEIAPSRRSIRIKLHSEGATGGKHRKSQSVSARAKGGDAVSDISAQLKSPTSPAGAGALTKYPKTPAPPRPLIPRRQPSYLNLEPLDRKHQKTLILDLDETLIHSMSKGGRMSTGHMVEVRLNQTYVAAGGQQMSLGPQHPILYWVNKRPYCDEFLRRVSWTSSPRVEHVC
jgi:CTD nuclear envelope phosphatase 1